VSALIAGLGLAFATGAFAPPAQAAVGPCRSDPVVVLNNLKTLDLSAVIQDTHSDLQKVDYTLHLPKGVYPIAVVPTDGLIGQVEHFNFVNDQPAGSYVDSTEAFTGKTVGVTATALDVLLGSGSASGTSNQSVTVHL
jgi:hypothetical protein